MTCAVLIMGALRGGYNKGAVHQLPIAGQIVSKAKVGGAYGTLFASWKQCKIPIVL